ncbi:MAG TPA: lipid A biosynthesis acyltransferase [Phycisphaerae bacterium]|nr:lipid A biosynthesis acyltransferase [Phycisphaerae bacterium]
MAKPRNKFLDYLAYLLLRVFAACVRMFAWEANYRTAKWIGNLLYRFDRRHRDRALVHLRLSFPDWSEEKCRRVARASMRNMVYLGLEVMFTKHLITPSRRQRHIRLGRLSEFVRLAVERKTGLICLTGHFGNWEVTSYTLGAVGFRSYAVARPLDNPYVNDFILGVREHRGTMILDKKGATQQLTDILDAKGIVGVVADQDAGRKGIFVDFFGRPASTYKSIGLLAMECNVPIAVMFGRRLDEQFHFEVGCRRIIYPHEWGDKDDPLRWITQEYTRALEDVIRTAPEQYLWVHRRWKHRPKGQEPGPDGVA